mmetsp:Transcript_1031/g.1743  ORF Transcript_1031/g.1743 Transcript_1031/m.1743 type:complete len:220 (+) Transcript_1031:1260-1919(+)
MDPHSVLVLKASVDAASPSLPEAAEPALIAAGCSCSSSSIGSMPLCNSSSTIAAHESGGGLLTLRRPIRRSGWLAKRPRSATTRSTSDSSSSACSSSAKSCSPSQTSVSNSSASVARLRMSALSIQSRQSRPARAMRLLSSRTLIVSTAVTTSRSSAPSTEMGCLVLEAAFRASADGSPLWPRVKGSLIPEAPDGPASAVSSLLSSTLIPVVDSSVPST